MTDKLDAIPGSTGRKIIDGLKDAVAGNFASVTIEGQRWVRDPAPEAGEPGAVDYERKLFKLAEEAYFKAGRTSDPQDWLQAGLLAQQHRNALARVHPAQISDCFDELSELESYEIKLAAAIGTCRFMDPPDGGDVSLVEQVRRMRAALDDAEDQQSTANSDAAALKAIAEGYTVTGVDDRYIRVENPKFKEDDGSAPFLMIDTATPPAAAPDQSVREALVKSLKEIKHMSLAYVSDADAVEWCTRIHSEAEAVLARAALSRPAPDAAGSEDTNAMRTTLEAMAAWTNPEGGHAAAQRMAAGALSRQQRKDEA